MNERLKESLSALLDGEVNELELQRILTSENRQEVSACWQRYHEVREWIQNDSSLRIKIDIRSSVMNAITKDEPPHKA
jgi:sigma-E factor negative regulatory protein RseA